MLYLVLVLTLTKILTVHSKTNKLLPTKISDLVSKKTKNFRIALKNIL